jgi:hypothetical protein
MVFVDGVEVDGPQSKCCLGSSAVISRPGISSEGSSNCRICHASVQR